MHTSSAFANVTSVFIITSPASKGSGSTRVPLAQTANDRKRKKNALNQSVLLVKFFKIITNMDDIRASGYTFSTSCNVILFPCKEAALDHI